MLNLMKCTNSLHFIYEDPAQKGAKIVQVHRYRTHSLDATQVPSPPKRGSFTKKTTNFMHKGESECESESESESGSSKVLML